MTKPQPLPHTDWLFWKRNADRLNRQAAPMWMVTASERYARRLRLAEAIVT